MYPATAQRAYYPALDILRGIAILAVVFYHNFDSVSLFRAGWMGVDLFFVLSGFLITELLLSSLDNKYFFRNFYIRRVLRIFPLYYLVLLAFFTLSPILFSERGPNTTFSYYTGNKLWFWTYIQNWLLVQKGPPPVPYLSHFWSLAIEEQFYLFWPFVLFFVRNISTLKKVIITLIILAIIIRVFTWLDSPQQVESYYCSTFTRMDSLLMGCLVAVHIKEGKEIPLSWIKWVTVGFALLIASSLLFFGNLRQDNFLFPTIGYSLSAAFFSGLLYLIIHKQWLLKNWFLKQTALRFIGKISYGMYVYHIPIYFVLCALLSQAVNRFFGDLFLSTMFLSGLSVLITILVSACSYYAIEKPILNLKKHFP